MGMFGKLFKGEDAASASDIADDDVGFGAQFIRIPSRNFFGPSCKSPSGRYILVWADGGPDQSRRGGWILLDQGKIVAEGRMPRPNDGKVADIGTFILNDWGAVEALSGRLSAFAPDGAVIFERSFQANLYNNGLSDDGRWAACQTANAPHEDGGRLFIFDLKARRQIGAFQPESGWAKDYTFSADGQIITLGYHDGGRFAYRSDGTFLDRSLWLASGLQNGDLMIIERILSEADGKPSRDLIGLLLPAIDRALGSQRYKDPKSRARAYRLRGTCFDVAGDLPKAAAAYEDALARDARVGVKRRLEQIRRLAPD
ncbi:MULTISPECIES: hypothetical protein [unclassified Bradyrhizobium]|uniref:hypothetical protein n=1 Tax=unclassified Bradyrhizobium TaxID=2631580 RepID=UPI0029164C94|nr:MULTISPECIES: hypothetical protein [unclassified Bradyrhizobium]